MAEIGFLGGAYGGIGMTGAEQTDVAIGSTVAPELASSRPEETVPRTATILALVAAAYLVVFVFHVVTF